MARKLLAVLLAFSWIALSDVDMLEDLDVESASKVSTPSSRPSTAKPAKFANNKVELANHTFEKHCRYIAPSSTADTKLATMSLDTGTSRSHKDNCILRI
jgi:hypothetical protein